MENPQLSQILAQNGQFVRALAQSLVRDPHRADDLVQETWLRAAAHPPRAAGSLRHWLRTVVRNLARTTARGELRRAQRDERAARSEALPSAAAEYEHAELLRSVVEAVLALEEPYRSTLLARYWRGWSAARVAEETKTPLATVRSREQRALEQLRGKLDKGWTGERGVWGLALTRLLASEPAPAAPLAKLGLAAGVVLAGALTWRAFESGESTEPVLPVPAAPAVAPLTSAAPSPAPRAASSVPTAPAREAVAALASEAAPGAGSEAFTAPPPSEVRVRFVYSDGTPAGGVACTLQLSGYLKPGGSLDEIYESQPADWEDQSGQSGADGRLAFSFVKPADRSVKLAAELPGCASTSWDWSELAPGQVLDLGNVPMRLGGVITGRIVRPDGTPILGRAWHVRAISVGLSTPGGRAETSAGGTSDPATGAFRIEGVMPVTNAVSARASLSGSVRANVTLTEGGTAEVDLVYSGPDPARRIVVDVTMGSFRTTQKPLAEHVRLLVPGEAPRTGFAFDDLQPGSYTVEIDDPRCVLWRQEGVSPGTRVDARLEGNSSVVMAVTDAETGSTAAIDDVVLKMRNVNSYPNQFRVQAFAGGRIDGMFAGDFTLEVRCGERTGSVDVDGLAIGETRSVALAVVPRPSVAGVVRFTDGAPAVGLDVSLQEPAQSGDSNASDVLRMGSFAGNDLSSFRIEVAKTQVDENGRFQLTAPRPGSYVVGVMSSDGTRAFSSIFALFTGPGDELELELARPGALSGRVQVPAGASATGLRLWALPVALGQEHGFDVLARTSTTLDETGAFTIPSVASGPARVFLMLPDQVQYRSSGWVGIGISWSKNQLGLARELGILDIPAGGVLEHDFTLADFPGRLELTVRVNGLAVPRLALTFRCGDETLEVGTDDDGVYRGPLFAGTYTLDVQDYVTPWSASAPGTIVITAGQPTIQTAELERP